LNLNLNEVLVRKERLELSRREALEPKSTTTIAPQPLPYNGSSQFTSELSGKFWKNHHSTETEDNT